MKAAITELEVKLQTLEHNEPIHRAEGDTGQADACATSAAEVRQAIAVLKFAETSTASIDAIAEYMYDTYCVAVGGVAFNGDPLPRWPEFSTDPGKQKQADAWRHVAGCVKQAIRPARTTFREDIAHAINCHSREIGSHTPDFILAEYLEGCLNQFDAASAAKMEWYKAQVEPDADLDEPLGAPQAACTDDVCESCQ